MQLYRKIIALSSLTNFLYKKKCTFFLSPFYPLSIMFLRGEKKRMPRRDLASRERSSSWPFFFSIAILESRSRAIPNPLIYLSLVMSSHRTTSPYFFSLFNIYFLLILRYWFFLFKKKYFL